MARIFLALRCFFRVLWGRSLPSEALRLGKAPGPASPAASEAARDGSAELLQLLGLLQKEGRLIDFLYETIDGYDDAQIGAAVRSIHRDCRRVLDEHCRLVPVLPGEDDAPVTIPPAFDPSRIRLIGNVTGEPPFNGTLRHHGWSLADINLPPRPHAADARVVAPAEVELA